MSGILTFLASWEHTPVLLLILAAAGYAFYRLLMNNVDKYYCAG